MVGTQTKMVTSVDVSGWTANDTSYFVPLVEATAEHFQVREVAADKAYLSRKNLKAVERVGGTPYVRRSDYLCYLCKAGFSAESRVAPKPSILLKFRCNASLTLTTVNICVNCIYS